MMADHSKYHTYGRQRSVRLPDESYSVPGTVVHLTACCHEMTAYFSNQLLAETALQFAYKQAEITGLKLWACCIMPNHSHLLVEVMKASSVRVLLGRNTSPKPSHLIQESSQTLTDKFVPPSKPGNPVSRFMRRWKSSIALFANKQGIPLSLQKSFNDRILKSYENAYDVSRYIVANPVRSGLVSDWKEYPFTYVDPKAL